MKPEDITDKDAEKHAQEEADADSQQVESEEWQDGDMETPASQGIEQAGKDKEKKLDDLVTAIMAEALDAVVHRGAGDYLEYFYDTHHHSIPGAEIAYGLSPEEEAHEKIKQKIEQYMEG